MILIYFIFGFINFEFTVSCLKNFYENIIKIAPIFFVVYVLMFFANYYVSIEIIQRHMGHNSGLKGWIFTILGSIIISGPPYVLFPLLGDLQKAGMKNSLIVAFLNNKNVQISFLPAMVYYFGLSLTIIVSVYILIFTVVSGILVGRLLDVKTS